MLGSSGVGSTALLDRGMGPSHAGSAATGPGGGDLGAAALVSGATARAHPRRPPGSYEPQVDPHGLPFEALRLGEP